MKPINITFILLNVSNKNRINIFFRIFKLSGRSKSFNLPNNIAQTKISQTFDLAYLTQSTCFYINRTYNQRKGAILHNIYCDFEMA